MNLKTNQARRDFIKGSAVVAGAALATHFAARAAHAAASDTIKIALIGCGGRGSGAAAQALSTEGPTKLICVADAFEDNAKTALNNIKNQFGEKVDVPGDRIFHGFDAYKKALEAGPDLVILATPPGFRPVHFEAAVKANKNIFMEKPVATDPAGVRLVLQTNEEAKKRNLKVGVGLQRHHQAGYLDIVKRLHDGAIGDINAMRVYWNDQGVWTRPRKAGQTEMEYQMRNWYYFNWLCGDHINEQHIHNLDVANWVLQGHPISAEGMGGRQVRTGIDNGEIYDHHAVEYTYKIEGKPEVKVFSQCRHMPECWNSVSEHAHGTKGYSDISGYKIFPTEGKRYGSNAKGGNPYQVEHDDLFNAIRNDKPYNEVEYGAHSTMTAILGRMATYSGKLIKWDDAINAPKSIMPAGFYDNHGALSFNSKPPTLPDENGRYPIPTPGKTKVINDEI